MKFTYFSVLFLTLISVPYAIARPAVLGEPLKDKYLLGDEGYDIFYRTGEVTNSYSMLCDMGQAIPDTEIKNWYNNKKIPGLKLELRARLAIKDHTKTYKPMGFVVITKNGEVLTKFKPLGDMVNGKWEGDVFNSWTGTGSDVKVYSERFGISGYAHFDLLSGNGFYYKSQNRDGPDYFLSNCKKIKKTNLPVYDWKFSSIEEPSVESTMREESASETSVC